MEESQGPAREKVLPKEVSFSPHEPQEGDRDSVNAMQPGRQRRRRRSAVCKEPPRVSSEGRAEVSGCGLHRAQELWGVLPHIQP